MNFCHTDLQYLNSDTERDFLFYINIYVTLMKSDFNTHMFVKGCKGFSVYIYGFFRRVLIIFSGNYQICSWFFFFFTIINNPEIFYSSQLKIINHVHSFITFILTLQRTTQSATSWFQTWSSYFLCLLFHFQQKATTHFHFT